ncbi:MAG: (2Fe-2S)-binding protein [Gammaproteobacteria bacterium]
MNPITPDDPARKKDIICRCSGTTKQQILKLIDDGADNPETISRITGTGAGCGACETELLELLAESRSI